MYNLNMRFHVVTIFPDMFESYLKESILGRAIKNKLVGIKFYNPRDFIKNPKNGYRPVDDKPYGGGPGMVMRAEPIIKAVEKALRQAQGKTRKVLIINFIPSAEKFTTTSAKNISKKYTDLILICGRYEGIDARIDKIFKTKKYSIGDYVLTGGELPAMVMIDSISRQIKGVNLNH
jgi:tRNA (guanine37-N1)-methyltransferase